jgi:hypothetical protein
VRGRGGEKGGSEGEGGYRKRERRGEEKEERKVSGDGVTSYHNKPKVQPSSLTSAPPSPLSLSPFF